MSDQGEFTRESMWNMLANITVQNDGFHLEKIIVMIKKDLTFDDPGIFASKAIVDEGSKRAEEGNNIWLLNRLIYILSINSNKPMENNLNLQKEILSACIVKQPWLFRKILQQYQDLVEKLINFEGLDRKQVVAFTVDGYDITKIGPACRFTPIELINDEQLLHLIECCMKVLIHGLVLGLDLEEDFFRKCSETFLSAFDALPMKIKLLGIEYFTKFMWNASECDHEIVGNVLHVLRGCRAIAENIPIWWNEKTIEVGRIESFSAHTLGFLESILPLVDNDVFKPSIRELFQIVVEILQHTSNYQDVNINIFPNRMKVEITQFLCILVKSINSEDLLKIQIKRPDRIIENVPEFIQVLRQFVLADITIGQEYFQGQNGASETWKIIEDQFSKALVQVSKHQDISDKRFSKNLKIVNETLLLSLTVNHLYQVWHQMKHLENSKCKFCESCPRGGRECEFIDKTTIKEIKYEFFDDRKFAGYARQYVEVIFAKKKYELHDFDVILESLAAILMNSKIYTIESDIQVRLIDQLVQQYSKEMNFRSKTFLELNAPPDHCKDLDQIILQYKQLREKCIAWLLNIPFQYLAVDTQNYMKDLIPKLIVKVFNDCYKFNYQIIIIQQLVYIFSSNSVPVSNLFNIIIRSSIDKEDLWEVLCKNLRNIICLLKGNASVFRIQDGTFVDWKVLCWDCVDLIDCSCDGRDHKLEQYNHILIEYSGIYEKFKLSPSIQYQDKDLLRILKYLQSREVAHYLIKAVPSIINHLNGFTNDELLEKWIELFEHNQIDVRKAFGNELPNIIKMLFKQPKSTCDNVLDKCFRKLLVAIQQSLENSNRDVQSCMVNILLKLATFPLMPEEKVFNLFRMTFLFFIRFESVVSYEASFCATEICLRHGVQPRDFLNWYKTSSMKLIVRLCVSIFLRDGITINRALSNISKMLGFLGPIDFLRHHYKIFVSMLLPWAVKIPKCVELIEEVAACTHQDMPTVLTKSFLTAYSYLFVNEEKDLQMRCVEFVIRTSNCSLYNHLCADIKRTVTEILIYYHRDPNTVMRVFRCLLTQGSGGTSTSEVSHTEIASFIADRFLGVLNFFETYITDPEFEKSLKSEVLLSVGDIMRFIGSNLITPFRFKILAMLRTALTIEKPDLKDACTKVCKIFINIVDIHALGQLLSTIVTSLEPLLASNPEEINEIYQFLIISNGSLLSLHIPDLYFIENMNVAQRIKVFVAQHTEKATSGHFLEKFRFFLNQVEHENLAVRVYGLQYLTKLFAENRQNLSDLIAVRNEINPIFQNVLENLMIGCRHTDRNLQLASGKCLGELGALEPSYLPPNYAPQRKFALSIFTDAFAIMALEELCRAYQFQKDTKYVDCFSLAIQEILVKSGVCPKTKTKMEVWEAIPERMRQLMMPLLTSCYTGLKTNQNIKVHPIFGSSKCQTSEQWAYIWASKMIEKITDENAQNLLNSFKPSIKRDSTIMSLFLPYVTLHALQSSSKEDCEKIFEEMHCVFMANIETDNVSDMPQINRNRLRELKTLQFKLINQKKEDSLNEPDVFEIKCAKLAFEQIDFLVRWLREWRKSNPGNAQDQMYAIIKGFVRKFDKKILAQANFNCGEYARALMYIESFIETNPDSFLQDNLSFLAQIYAKLMDSDSLEGAVGLKKTELTLLEQILINNMTDRLTESTACFEKLMQSGIISQNDVRDIVQCYLRLDTPETALHVSEGLFNSLGSKYANESMREIQAEPLWRLGMFEELEGVLSNKNVGETSDWGVQCGQALLSFRSDEQQMFEEKIQEVELSVLKTLRTGGVEQDSYHKGYSQVIKLHFLSEIRKTKLLNNKLVDCKSETEGLNLLCDFFKDLRLRLAFLQPNPRMTEPVLCLRRILLTETQQILDNTSGQSRSYVSAFKAAINQEIGKLWLHSTELTQKAGMFQQAQLCIMNAEQYKPENLFLEKAKLFWQKGQQTNCFKVIEQKISEIVDINNETQSLRNATTNERNIYAEAKFLQATYNAESMNISPDLNQKYFKQSIESNPKSEKTHVHFARYLDRIYTSLSEEEQQKGPGRDKLLHILECYGKSMVYGCEFIYQSLPRMLTIWLDFTAQQKTDEQFKKYAEKMNGLIEKFANRLPTFVFYTAFSQLVSRLCHPSDKVYEILKTIIVKLILNYPQQSLWMIISSLKSSYANRKRRCLEILNDQRLKVLEKRTLITDFNTLAEKLIELTNKEIPAYEKHPTVSGLVRDLPRLFKDPNFSRIVLPFQQYMQATLPSTEDFGSTRSSQNVFPNKSIYINGIKEEIEVLMSLQKPRKIRLIGSDGKSYAVILKARDDLRRDFRLMEFNAVLKRYLYQDPDARYRRLSIRTYSVVPLNEECGLIEWVENLHSFRRILTGYYKQRGLGLSPKEIKSNQCGVRDTAEKKRYIFQKVLLPKHPPLFSEWFKERFTTPHNWYQARSSYIRTTAVMSIVGYILGLGDRHGENILFDGTNGDIVHVDFNCLFNKGETFDFPERIPFRLTHNMVHAMGPLGVEGLYRKCCEITLRVLQAQTPTLMSVLRPFVYDTLVSWNRGYQSDGITERTDPQAMNNVNHIEERLKGYVKIKGRTSNMPLSTEGQVNFVISEATDIDNLAAMYIGWGPYL